MHPILYKNASFTIYSYGLCTALAVLTAWALANWLARRVSLPSAKAGDILFLLFISGILGARAWYVLQHVSDYQTEWYRVFLINEGGLVWYGGLLGALAAALVYAKITRTAYLQWADFFSPILPVGQAIGRIGCFLNGCCFGKDGHPVQLYESASMVLLSFFLFRRFFAPHKQGTIFASYLIGYGTLRFALEFLRGDQSLWNGLTIAQWTSLALVVTGLWIFKRFCR